MIRFAPTVAMLVFGSSVSYAVDVPILQDGQAVAEIVVDQRGSSGGGPAILEDAGRWLADSLREASGAEFTIRDEAGPTPAIVIARADAWPAVAASGGLDTSGYENYAIVTQDNRVYVLGTTEAAARYGVADLLHRWGFRWFAPSPKWRWIPTMRDLALDLTTAETPSLIERRIWYAYGMKGDDLDPLIQNYVRWAVANRVSLNSPMRTGHSYGNMILRNPEAFAEHPEYFALLPDGTRDNERAVNARKLCVSNPDLIRLVIADRRKLLATDRLSNPAAFMVSVDPSDGEGTCHCANCEALGTTTDRVFHLANEVAKGLRAEDPRAWVGLYAYSSHRLPPTIEIEPNVYVQVAMGFNRTEFSLPELVERWSEKVSAIGLREYYGVEAWDWGLPGRARGGQMAYHRRWIPYYAARRLNAINAETNSNWGAQTPGLYVAAQLLWDTDTDVDATVDEFYELAFGEAAEPMRGFYQKMEAAPPLRPSALVPMFEDLQAAWNASHDLHVRARLTDLQAYLIYVARFREFDLARSRSPVRGDEYYDALRPLMTFAWRIRLRDTIHYYALARRLCNGLPLQDGRLDFYMANADRDPVWKSGDPLTDAEIQVLFVETLAGLKADHDPTVNFSRYLDRVNVPGEDAGPSRIHADEREAVARFRGGLLGYLVPSGPMLARFGIRPTSRPVTMTVFMRDDVLFEQKFAPAGAIHDFEVQLPRAFEFRVEITGEFELRVPPETPFVFEASAVRPAWIDYSGPHYFYVPAGTTELITDAEPRLSLIVPGAGRRDLIPADRIEGKQHMIVAVPAGKSGQIWHTTAQTRGHVALLNVPPLLSFHRRTVIVPREVAEAEGLTTSRREDAVDSSK